MGSVDKGLVQKLQEAGNRLAQLPTDVDELLPLLDHVESLLSRVEQSPPELIQKAYSPSMKALLEESLLRHSDVNVKVAIASCISEITRITAPEAPYNDEQMKDVFQLIVSSFENLSDKSSRSYDKRASILETVAKVRSCVVMLDLECDSLIVEMFQHFLNSIRDYHPENVFACMETIMTLVLEESEDVSLELLTPILASLKKDNEEIPTIARILAERVFEKCAVKIKPYLMQAVKSLGVPLDDYSKVVASICEGRTDAVENNDVNVSGELAEERKLASFEEAVQVDKSKLITSTIDEAGQEVKEHVTEEAPLEEAHPEAERSPKSGMSNGITETGNEGTSVVPESLKKPDESNFTSEYLDVNITNKMDTDASDAGKSKSAKSESKAEQTSNKIKGRKSSSIPNLTEPSDSSHVDEDKEAVISCPKTSEKEAEKSPDPRKSDSKDTHVLSGEDQNVATGASSENEKELTAKISSPKALDSEVAIVASLFPSKSLPDESLPKKAGQPKKKDNLVQEDAPSVDPVPAKVADGTSDSEAKPQRHSGKKKENWAQDDAPHMDSVPEKGTDVTSDSEVKRQRRSGKKKENLPQDVAPSMDPVPTKVADRTSDSEAKPQRRSGKKKENLAEEDAPSLDTVSVKAADVTSDLAVKPQRRLGKKKENLTQEDAPSADPVSVKVADAINDSNIKRQRRSGKKTTAHITKEENVVAGRGTSKTEGDATSDSEAKPLRQCTKKGEASDLEAKPLKKSGKEGETSRTRGKPLKQSAGKKGDASDSETKPSKLSSKKEDTSNEDKLSLKKDDGKKRGRGKDASERDLVKSPIKDDDQDMVSSPKSTSKSVKEEGRGEDPKTNSKRKRTPGKDKVLPSSSDKVSQNVEYGPNLVGSKVKVWWPKDRAFYEGEIASFDPHSKKHKVLYTDGDEEILALQKEKWEFVEGRTMQQEADEDSNHDSSAKTHKRKKAKTNSGTLAKTNQMDVSPKRAGASSSSKSKRKTTKNLAKSDGESDEDLLQAAKKSNDDDGSMSKTTAKSKQETPKMGTKTKGKSPKSGNKSNGTGKGKSSLSKVKETEDTKGKSSDSAKTPDIDKARGSETKSGKKRRRGFKG